MRVLSISAVERKLRLLISPGSLRKWWAIKDTSFSIPPALTVCRESVSISRSSQHWGGARRQLCGMDCAKHTPISLPEALRVACDRSDPRICRQTSLLQADDGPANPSQFLSGAPRNLENRNASLRLCGTQGNDKAATAWKGRVKAVRRKAFPCKGESLPPNLIRDPRVKRAGRDYRSRVEVLETPGCRLTQALGFRCLGCNASLT
jgi:hypothetical protein